jgi:Spy/CpxP family protein refolding chaperone
MQRSKGLAALLLIAALIVGGAIGFSLHRFIHRPPACPPSPRGYWNHLAHEWELTPQQRVKIDSLLDMQHKKIAALFDPTVRQMDSLRTIMRAISDSTQEQMRLILTPEQRQKLDALHRDMRRRDSIMRACRPQRWNGKRGRPMPPA